MNTNDGDRGYCATCVHCHGVDEEKDVCICERHIEWADWRNGKEGPCPFWSDHIPTEAEKLIDRIFVAVTNEEACAEAIVAEVEELLSTRDISIPLTPLQITSLNEIAANISRNPSSYSDYEDLSTEERDYLLATLRNTYHMNI